MLALSGVLYLNPFIPPLVAPNFLTKGIIIYSCSRFERIETFGAYLTNEVVTEVWDGKGSSAVAANR